MLITVPLCVQLICLYAVLHDLVKLEEDNEREARVVQHLVHVNLMWNEVMSAGGALVKYKAFSEQRYLDEFHKRIAKMYEHRDILRAMQLKDPEYAAESESFFRIMNDAEKIIMQLQDTHQSENALASIRSVGKFDSLVRRVNAAGEELVKKELTVHKHYRELQKQNRLRLQQTIKFCSLVNLVLAILMAMILNATFAKRMKVLADNAVNIAIGKPLEEPLTGSDELATLDGVIHSLSSELAQSRQKERAMIENAIEIICSLDERLRITQLNPAVTRVLGYNPDELLGTAIQSLVHEEDQAITFNNLSQCKTSKTDAAFEARIKTKDGRYRFLDWRARWSEEEKAVFCVVHDISERKESERLKQDVLAMLSHDLRSVLTSLGITLDLLNEGHLGKLTEKGNRMVSNANESVAVVVKMINDLLEVERIESESFTLDYHRVSLNDVIKQASDIAYADAETKKIEIEISGEEQEIDADPERLKRVIINLLNNAIKFSPSGGIISVVSQRISENGGMREVEVRVIDQGPGIPADKAHLVFQKFKQLGRGDEGERKGSGLGLAICRAIVEAHGGKIGVDSGHNGGSALWFTLPVNRPGSHG
ncbi:MAG TPA: ATP-binding protein [Candidatus Obscuribacterales bacterium]